MPLISAEIEDFRCFFAAKFELDPKITLIVGPNGAGKSSLLEALFLLGRGRSFRTNKLETAIRQGAERLRVVGNLRQDNRSFVLGVEAESNRVSARIAGEPASSLAALTTAFPVQIIEPGIHKLIEEGPVLRRRYLDWGVFHVEPTYLEQWQRFHRVLRQRNAALRTHPSDRELDAWDLEFAATGEEITRARAAYLDALRPFVSSVALGLLGEPFEVSYTSGWKSDEKDQSGELLAVLRANRVRDRQRRISTVGPHRGDLIVRSREGLAKESVSRGQQKLLATALVLGQLSYHRTQFDMKPTLLLDDPAAELDAKHLELLLGQLEQLDAQLVMTSLNPNITVFGKPGRVFHVEQGRLTGGS